MKSIILLGAPGAGKGTQATKIATRYNIPHISTGDIFRKNLKEGTELGLRAKAFIDKGQLVPDSVVIDIVKDRLTNDDCKNGYLLDGFPRTVAQAEALSEIADISVVVNLAVDLNRLAERLTGRRVCGECGESYHITTYSEDTCKKCNGKIIQRDDDKIDTVNSRLKVYTEQTEPLIEYYEKRGKLKTVDGLKSIDEVTASVFAILD